jgi:TonB-linked SusC/RagA family outer membrane protein
MKSRLANYLALAFVLFLQFSFAQERTVTGTVTDGKGMTIAGASVMVKGTKQGTQTDFDGKFKISASTSQTLVFSFIGMLTKEVVASSSVVNVKLEDNSKELEGVVVTALGIKREKASIGAASTTLKSEQINRGSQTSMADALKGKIAGVTISSASTDPGASSGVIIRGFNSLSGSNQPLYIVDGVPINDVSNFEDNLTGGYDFGRGSGDINPNDIDTMTILKGASGTALYGSRAANGVILITTKKGKSGKIAVEITSNTTFTNILRTPKYQSKFGQGWDGQHILIENGSWGPAFDNKPRVWGNVVNSSQLVKPYSFQKDQLENFFDTGLSTFNSVALSGGSDASNVRLTYSNTQQDGIYPTKADSFERNTIGLNASTKVNKISISGSLNYVGSSGSGIATGQGLSVMNNLMQIPTDIPISEFKDYKGSFHNVSNYYTPYGITNPYFTLNEDGTKYNKDRLYGSVDFSYDINKWSSFTYRFGLDQSSDLVRRWTARVDALPGSPNNGSSTEQPGSYQERSENLLQQNHDLLYNLDLDLGSNFKLASTFGWNINKRETRTSNANIGSQDIAGFYSFQNSADTPTVVPRRESRKLYGVFNTTTLSYDDQVYLTGNIRNDWYSTLPKENQTALYGGVNTSWIITKTFPILTNVLSYGKLRAGYGETGVDTDPYLINSIYAAGSADNQGFQNLNFPLGGVNAYEVGNRLANPTLKPEIRKEFEVGAELSFFKNRINIDFNYYNSKVENQILNVPLAASSGYTTQTSNVGTISNKGVEALVTLHILKRNDNGFNWSTTVNYAKNKSLLEKLDSRLEQVDLGGLGGSGVQLVAREGQPIGLLLGLVPLKDPNGNIVVDVNGVPISSPNKEVYGNTQYDYTMGIGNTFSYRNFTLDFSFDIRKGGLMFSRTADITRFTGNSITTTYNDRRPFVVPNSVNQNIDSAGNITYTPNVTPVDNEHQDDYYRADALSRENVIDKSFVKLREVIIGYNLPSKFLKGTSITNLNFSIIGRNLFLWTPVSNQYIDPETSTFGTDLRGQFGEFSANPSTKSLGFSLKANF